MFFELHDLLDIRRMAVSLKEVLNKYIELKTNCPESTKSSLSKLVFEMALSVWLILADPVVPAV